MKLKIGEVLFSIKELEAASAMAQDPCVPQFCVVDQSVPQFCALVAKHK